VGIELPARGLRFWSTLGTFSIRVVASGDARRAPHPFYAAPSCSRENFPQFIADLLPAQFQQFHEGLSPSRSFISGTYVTNEAKGPEGSQEGEVGTEVPGTPGADEKKEYFI